MRRINAEVFMGLENANRRAFALRLPGYALNMIAVPALAFAPAWKAAAALARALG
jgi:hypothetical protein